MLWALISRPLTVMATLAGVVILSPLLVPLTAVLVKPLIKPVANLYFDIAEEIGEVMEEREKMKDRQEKVLSKRGQAREAKEIQEGSKILDQVGELL
jgi:hypothetical protein